MYRPYTKDPHSLAALDRKTKKELSDTKEGYEEEIKKINKVFSQKDYDLNKKKKEKIHEVEKAFESLKEEFNKLKIQIKKRYFIWKNFFGGIQSATEVQYVVCERSDLSNSVIKKLQRKRIRRNESFSRSSKRRCYHRSMVEIVRDACRLYECTALTS